MHLRQHVFVTNSNLASMLHRRDQLLEETWRENEKKYHGNHEKRKEYEKSKYYKNPESTMTYKKNQYK